MYVYKVVKKAQNYVYIVVECLCKISHMNCKNNLEKDSILFNLLTSKLSFKNTFGTCLLSEFFANQFE